MKILNLRWDSVPGCACIGFDAAETLWCDEEGKTFFVLATAIEGGIELEVSEASLFDLSMNSVHACVDVEHIVDVRSRLLLWGGGYLEGDEAPETDERYDAALRFTVMALQAYRNADTENPSAEHWLDSLHTSDTDEMSLPSWDDLTACEDEWDEDEPEDE